MNPHAVTFEHQKAMEIMRATPGMTYDAACAEVIPTVEVENQARRAAPPRKPGKVGPPAFHEPAMAYMLEHPGISYDTACTIVQSMGRCGISFGPVM